jgi:hypothetical protein
VRSAAACGSAARHRRNSSNSKPRSSIHRNRWPHTTGHCRHA